MTEKIIIGTLIEKGRTIQKVEEFLKPRHFHTPKYQLIYTLIQQDPEMKMANLAKLSGVDYIELTELIKFSNEFEIINSARELVEQYLCKELNYKADALKEMAKNGKLEDAYELLEIAKNEIENTTSGTQIKTIKEITSESLKNLDERIQKNKNNIPLGIKLPFAQLQYLTAGLQTGVYIIGARPGVGKTAVGIKFANTAADNGHTTAYFSLEMKDTALVDRMIIGKTGLSKDDYRHGKISGSQRQMIKEMTDKINSSKLFIIENAEQSIESIQRDSKILKRKHDLKLIVIDYLQLIQIENSSINKRNNREQEVSYISRKIKKLSKSLNIPIILMCQLNRESEKEGKIKRPGLAQLRESGSLEQDCDLAMLLFRPDKSGIETYEDKSSTKDLIELIIVKHREGDLATITVKHNGSMTDFYDIDNQPSNTDFKQLNQDLLSFSEPTEKDKF
jgi:replicative DNA helicase